MLRVYVGMHVLCDRVYVVCRYTCDEVPLTIIVVFTYVTETLEIARNLCQTDWINNEVLYLSQISNCLCTPNSH